jgi:WD40 repeat protein
MDRPYYWSPNSQRVITTVLKLPPEVWNPLNGNTITTFTKDDDILALDWSADSQYIASFGAAMNVVYIWNTTTGEALFRYVSHAPLIVSIAWSPNGQLIACGGSQGSTEVWQAT